MTMRYINRHYLSIYYLMVQEVLTGRSTGLGFDLAWFGSLSLKHLYIFSLRGAVQTLKKFLMHFFLYLLVS